jgi:hypothetical protein
MARDEINKVIAEGMGKLTADLDQAKMGLVLVGIDVEGNLTMRATVNLPKSTLLGIFNQLASTGIDMFQGDAEGNPVAPMYCNCPECQASRAAHN